MALENEEAWDAFDDRAAEVIPEGNPLNAILTEVGSKCNHPDEILARAILMEKCDLAIFLLDKDLVNVRGTIRYMGSEKDALYIAVEHYCSIDNKYQIVEFIAKFLAKSDQDYITSAINSYINEGNIPALKIIKEAEDFDIKEAAYGEMIFRGEMGKNILRLLVKEFIKINHQIEYSNQRDSKSLEDVLSNDEHVNIEKAQKAKSILNFIKESHSLIRDSEGFATELLSIAVQNNPQCQSSPLSAPLNEFLNMADLLLEFGADINAELGMKNLMQCAAMSAGRKMMAHLIDKGGDIYKPGKGLWEETAFDLVKKHRHPDVKEVVLHKYLTDNPDDASAKAEYVNVCRELLAIYSKQRCPKEVSTFAIQDFDHSNLDEWLQASHNFLDVGHGQSPHFGISLEEQNFAKSLIVAANGFDLATS